MATVVLGAVGTLVGGPLGGAVGSLVGNLIDRSVLGGAKATGPRLADLAVQTSSYGTRVPALFGTLRVAGTVIWATDLKEDRHGAGGGKGGAKTTSYSYSASFAVALSARRIARVGRIWADGNLLRDGTGEWKAATGFRLYLGGEDQAPDPLIAAAEGLDRAPAHRGLAYAVFQDLQLADFGNRIPSLTFEVVADDGMVAAPAIAAALTGGALAGEGGVALGGFAAVGDTVRDALDALAGACPLPLADDGAVLRIAAVAEASIDPAWAGAAPAGTRQPAEVRDRADAGTLPDAVALRYHEPARDWQVGLQRARRDGIGRRELALDLPAGLDADAARALAETALARSWAERDRATLRLPLAALPMRAGTAVRLADNSRWRIAEWTLEAMAVTLRLRRLGVPAPVIAGADPGRAVTVPAAPAGRTVAVLLDLPALDDAEAAAPQLWLAAAGTAPGWRRAAVRLSLDDGTSWSSAGWTAAPAAIGHAALAVPPGAPPLFNRAGVVEVALLHDGMALAGADDDALAGGANLAWLGGELIQFGSAERLAPARWRLGRLVRGRRGTEAVAATGQATGAPFVLLDPAALLPLSVPLAALGTTARVAAEGPNDGGVPAVADTAVLGLAVRPPSPMHLRAVRGADQTIRLDWTRRGRLGWAWTDGGDVAPGEDGERYRLQLRPAAGATRTVEIDQPWFLYTADLQAADGAADAAGLAIELTMLGARAPSLPAAATWTWQGVSP